MDKTLKQNLTRAAELIEELESNLDTIYSMLKQGRELSRFEHETILEALKPIHTEGKLAIKRALEALQ